MRNSIVVNVLVLVATAVMGLSPAVSAQVPPGQADLRSDPYYADYVDTVAYWFQSVDKENWESRLEQALIEAPDQDLEQYDDDDLLYNEPSWVRAVPGSERVVLTGLPLSSWWIDVWRQGLDGKWTKVPSWHPSDQLPSPVSGDLLINGKLPAPYIMLVHDKSGAALGEAKLFLVSWTQGSGGPWEQVFDFPNLPVAPEKQLSRLPW